LGQAKARPQNQYARAGFAEEPVIHSPNGGGRDTEEKAGFVPITRLSIGKGFALLAICPKAYGERHLTTFWADR